MSRVFSVACQEPETQDLKFATVLRVAIVDPVELVDLEAHHIFRGDPDRFFVAIGDSVFCHRIRGHRRVLQVNFAVHGEKGSCPSVDAVVFLQGRIELIRVALHHGFVDQRTGAIFRQRADQHAADDGASVGNAVEDHDAVVKVGVGKADGEAEAAHETGMRLLFGE